ncbi:hypothetical protein D3C76_967870 [compost metagenome]
MCVQGPDHAVKGTPAAQALPRGDAAIIEFGLGAATPEQDGVVACEPFFIFQVGGDGGDLIGFADNQQQTDFVAPEMAVMFAQVIIETVPFNVIAARSRGSCTEFFPCPRYELQCPQLSGSQRSQTFEKQDHHTSGEQPSGESHPFEPIIYRKDRVLHPYQQPTDNSQTKHYNPDTDLFHD